MSIDPLSPWLLLPSLVAALLAGRLLAGIWWRRAADRGGDRWRTGTAGPTALALLGLAGGLLASVLTQRGPVRLDEPANRWLERLRDERVVHLFDWLTGLGDISTLAIVAVVALLLFWLKGDRPARAGLAVSATSGLAITWMVKYIVDRERPAALTFAEAVSPSFPSGHATGAMAVYGFIALAIAHHLPDDRDRLEVIYWMQCLVLLVAASRMILGLHYLTDVVAGLLIGGFGVMVGILVAAAVSDRRHP